MGKLSIGPAATCGSTSKPGGPALLLQNLSYDPGAWAASAQAVWRGASGSAMVGWLQGQPAWGQQEAAHGVSVPLLLSLSQLSFTECCHP